MVELTKDKKTKERFTQAENAKVNGMLKKRLIEAGLLGMFSNPIRLVPPLIITGDEIDEIVSGLDEVIVGVGKELSL